MRTKINKKSILFAILSIVWMTVIFIFSNQNADDSTDQSDFVTRILLMIFMPDYNTSSDAEILKIISSLSFIIRKAAHFSIYAILGIFTYFTVYFSVNKKIKSAIVSLLICFIYACSDEMHQLFISGRSGQIRDVFIDFSGALTATIIVLIIFKIKAHLKTKQP